MKIHLTLLFFLLISTRVFGLNQNCTLTELSDPTFFKDGLKDLVNYYGERRATSPAENQRFIKTSQNQNQERMTFLHWDFKALKLLNDKIFVTPSSFGKLGVDAVVRLGQEILLLKIQESPILKDLIVAKYSDYKSVRLALYSQQSHSKIIAEVSRLAKEAQQDFAKVIENTVMKEGEIANLIKNQNSHIPEWHTFEVARKSSDMASTFARFSHARQLVGLKPGEKVTLEKVGETVQLFEAQIRQSLLKEVASEAKDIFFERGPLSGELLVSKQMLEVIRKGPGQENLFISYLQAMSEARFNIRLSKKTCQLTHKYFQLIDLFAPSVLVAEPVEISLKNANKGALSVDFAGQNVFNLFYTADALVQSQRQSKSRTEAAELAVKNSRENDKNYATPRLQALRDNIQSVAERYNLGEVKFTGDDGMIVLSREINSQIFENVMQDLAKFGLTGITSEYRLVYMHPIKKGRQLDHEAMRLKISASGESAEKSFRSESANYHGINAVSELGIGVMLYPGSMNFVFVGKGSQAAQRRMELEIKNGFTKKYGYTNGNATAVPN